MAFWKRVAGLFGILMGLNSMKNDEKKTLSEQKSLVTIPKKYPVPKEISSDIAGFMTIVQCLNEGLEDDRLETDKGAVWALFELKDFYALQGQYVQVVVNEKRRKDGTALVWFEV